MREQVFLSLVTALSPIFLSFIFKRIDVKNETSSRQKKMEEVQKKLDFLSNYYTVQSSFLDSDKLVDLKKELSEDASKLKSQIHLVNKEVKHFLKNELTGFQRIFISFRPLTLGGWIWLLLFYANLIFLSFAFLGYGLNEQGQVTSEAFREHLGDTDNLIGTVVFVLLMLLFRWLALMSYDNKYSKTIEESAQKQN